MQATLSIELARTLKQIPGYDPFATAGDCTFDEAAARHALDFIAECCTHVKGELAGQPFKLEPWQQAIIANLYGWIRPDGSRRYREAFIFVPRKNGKSTMIAAIVLYALFCEGEPGAEIYSAAAEREQARLVYEQVAGMIRNEPVLRDSSTIYKYSVVVGGASYKAISAEAGSKHGFNSSLVVVDELHAQPNRELVDVLATSMGSRRQPLMIHITTSDFDRESICNEKHDYAGKVRDGILEDRSFLPVIYEATTEDAWTDPKVWAKANPNLGISLSEDNLARECQRAQDSPAFENTFKRLHLNIRTEQEVRWLRMASWDACDGAVEVPDGGCCWCGLDLAATSDVTAFVAAFRGEDGGYILVPKFWLPQEKAKERDRRDRVPYLTWARQGFITLTEGNVVDYEAIRRDINEFATRYTIEGLAADPWNAYHILRELGEDDGLPVFEHRQGFASMAAPTKEFERAVLDGKIAHGGNPVLRWMASNVTVETDAAGNLKPSKKKSTEKIDGIVASIMAIGRASLGGESAYEDHGVFYAGEV